MNNYYKSKLSVCRHPDPDDDFAEIHYGDSFAIVVSACCAADIYRHGFSFNMAANIRANCSSGVWIG